MILPPKIRSLALRLSLISAVWGLIALVLASVILTTLFRGSVERNFDRQIINSLRELTRLVATRATSPDTIGAIEQIGLSDPQYREPVSGWYWQVLRLADDEIIAESRSLFGDTLPDLPPPDLYSDDEEYDRRTSPGPDNEPLRVLRRDIDIDGIQYRLIATGNLEAVDQDVAEFRNLVLVTLGLFGLGLVLASFLMVRVGLQPLEQIRRSLAAIRSGDKTRLTGSFPKEIVPLVAEVNALLQSNRGILDRARTHVGNLAHGLKTPLSVLTNEARAQGEKWSVVAEQARLMKAQIETYLARAQMAARSTSVIDTVNVLEVVEPLIRTMERLYPAVDIETRFNLAPQTRFRGEHHDFEEILGNLIDNACKYANSAVSISLLNRSDAAQPHIVCVIEDDGPGLTMEEIALVMKRGKRLDEQKPGSGLGLSIVEELVQVYSGELTIVASRKGGLLCTLYLPTVA